MWSLLAKNDQQPSKEWYDNSHQVLAHQGLRVLALAYKKLSPTLKESVSPRSFLKSGTLFVYIYIYVICI